MMIGTTQERATAPSASDETADGLLQEADVAVDGLLVTGGDLVQPAVTALSEL